MKRILKPRKDEIIITMDISEWEILQRILFTSEIPFERGKEFAKELFRLPLSK